jgi:hypothetical protein
MKKAWRWWLLWALLFGQAAKPLAVRAHIGAPYPVLIEEPVGPYLVSALADPDVGIGTFYVQVTLPGDQPLPEDTTVSLAARPEDGHAPEATFVAERQQTRYGERFVANVAFDSKGPWQMRLMVNSTAGRAEQVFPVKVTPSGTGWLGTLACLVPFLALAGLWLRGSLRQPRASASPRTAQDRQSTLAGHSE